MTLVRKVFTLICASLGMLTLSVSCWSPNELAPRGMPEQARGIPARAPAQVPASRSSDAEFESWRSMMLLGSKPRHACLVATYPERQWREIRCVKPRNVPLVPAEGIRGATVGNRTDYAAATKTGLNFAQGYFERVTGVKSEYVEESGQRFPNLYSLQLNTEFFATATCKRLGSPDPQNCSGWEQFTYQSNYGAGISIEYWLIDFGPKGTKCPAGWYRYIPSDHPNEVYCQVYSSETPAPAEKITSLQELVLTGAVAGSIIGPDDGAALSVHHGTGKLYIVNGDNRFPDLHEGWHHAEFNVFGDCCGDEAIFNSGSAIVVRTLVSSGTTTAPACDLNGWTGETNNLTLTGTSKDQGEYNYPSIVFRETNAAPTKSSCVPEGS
jgi:hypothetical protein